MVMVTKLQYAYGSMERRLLPSDRKKTRGVFDHRTTRINMLKFVRHVSERSNFKTAKLARVCHFLSLCPGILVTSRYSDSGLSFSHVRSVLKIHVASSKEYTVVHSDVNKKHKADHPTGDMGPQGARLGVHAGRRVQACNPSENVTH